jgi:hypothetical protein
MFCNAINSKSLLTGNWFDVLGLLEVILVVQRWQRYEWHSLSPILFVIKSGSVNNKGSNSGLHQHHDRLVFPIFVVHLT